ncbi:hypothetical protein E2C01_039776 [Portunus trituberculatus]|uniref:Uncharacterized protein n=1 Tax=Portunus trituberculatus TaxID=210409 RepID=A0A5B7FKN9_PORTR|nr:hypothetical protein [Portunus trituberculatus]
MEATWQQVSNNCRLVGQVMTHWYQLHTSDAQYAVGDCGWRYNPCKKRDPTPKLQRYWECGKAVHCSATTHSHHLQERGKDLSVGQIMYVTVTMNSWHDYFCGGEGNVAAAQGGVVKIAFATLSVDTSMLAGSCGVEARPDVQLDAGG